MNEKMYILMHRDTPVCSLMIDISSGAILKASKPQNPELLPLGGCIDSEALRKWWLRRAVPVGQGNIKHILAQLGIATPQEYLVRNLGLSLTDHYWIKPLEMEAGWDDINLFTNDFRDAVGNMQFGTEETAAELSTKAFSPSSSVQGELRKKWIISDGRRCLIKGNHGSNSQESLNEVAATLLHQKQNAQPFVSYKPIHLENNAQVYCICESFTSDCIELIPAIDVVDSKKKNNATSMYEHFIQVCVAHGLSDNQVRNFLEYQILTDFVLTNTDRHLNNFGVLRDTTTLKFIGMAPIFDSGNSMFWNDPRKPEREDLTDIEVNSFVKKELKLLDYVQNKNQLDTAKLPSCEDLREIYSMDPLIPCVDSILLGYRKKIDLLLSP